MVTTLPIALIRARSSLVLSGGGLPLRQLATRPLDETSFQCARREIKMPMRPILDRTNAASRRLWKLWIDCLRLAPLNSPMMNIASLTLNPTIDVAYEVDQMFPTR